jgi:DNA replicative helicase MCM subunit Mcm2 (Cdc46/Mcm family)
LVNIGLEIDYTYVNAVTVEVQDSDSFNELDRLSAYLFNNDTEKIRVGETIILEGQIVINEFAIGKNKKIFPYFYADHIRYDRNYEITLTQSDIDAVHRFTKMKSSSIIDELVSMFDISIIGNDYVKKGLLLCAVNSAADTNSVLENRGRLHSLLIGPPGLAKTRFLRSVCKLIPNSRFESGQSSTGKSLTAIVSKEDDNHVLRYGPVPLAGNAICAINEFGKTSFEDQSHLLDVMEEGEFTINKYGMNAPIKAPTTIIVSANPINNSTWKSDNGIDINEIPALKPIIDRFDLIFVFRSSIDQSVIREYAYRKSEYESRKVPDYSAYLTKHLEYAKRINPTINDEASVMLNEFFIKVKTHGYGSNRLLDSLFRTSKAFARLQLKRIVDAKIAQETMDFFNVMLSNYQEVTNIILNPRDLAYEICVDILKQIKFAITLDELLKNICDKSDQVRRYLTFGNRSLRLRDNKKCRNICDMLLNHANIKKIQERPIVLQYLDTDDSNSLFGTSDPSDPSDRNELSRSPLSNLDDSQIKDQTESSYRSQGSFNDPPKKEWQNDSQNNIETQSFLYECYYCDYCTDFQHRYESHVVNKHPKKLSYPNKASLAKMRIKCKGKSWE